MVKANAFSAKGIKQAEVTLPKRFEEKENSKLLSQAIHVYRERSHIGLAKTKTRSEVIRTTKKWYRQKGTGGARHGARSAPIFVGGGVAHGPRPLRKELVLPVKMKIKALDLALSAKAKEERIIVVSGLSTLNKTGQVAKLIEKFQDKNKKIHKFTFVLNKENSINKKIFRNISNVCVKTFNNINAYDVFFGGMLIFDKDIFNKKTVKKIAKKITNRK
ncbi:MAG: 50S ribosomal protein L4 [bacterium]|nr:50S ribosomal protein L4 [bacterium]